jgi:hypothetical protein
MNAPTPDQITKLKAAGYQVRPSPKVGRWDMRTPVPELIPNPQIKYPTEPEAWLAAWSHYSA